MSSAGGATSGRWVVVLTEADDRGAMDAAARLLWERYFDRVVRLARRWLRTAQTGISDVDDVALSAIKRFWHGVSEGEFPRMDDRHNLGRILVTIAACRAAGAYRRKRGSS